MIAFIITISVILAAVVYMMVSSASRARAEYIDWWTKNIPVMSDLKLSIMAEKMEEVVEGYAAGEGVQEVYTLIRNELEKRKER